MNNSSNKSRQLQKKLAAADAVILGAGSGLSTAAGLTYSGPRFEKYFHDFEVKYGIHDMYSGGFYPFKDPTVYWAWWSRMIWVNRYQKAPKQTYQQLLKLVQDQNYFVLTTNVDHQFQLAGFDKQRLFYTQGDYGLFQRADLNQTYSNYDLVKAMVLSQGFEINQAGQLVVPEGTKVKMHVASELAEQAAIYQRNLREDDQFVEDEGWQRAAARFNNFVQQHQHGKVVYWELGVGMNTPVIIKYPFWKWTARNPQATFVTMDQQVMYPPEIAQQTLAFQGDINDSLASLIK